MPGPNTPTSHNLTAAANAVGAWASPILAKLLTVTNEGTGPAWVTVDGSTPTVNGDNQYFIPAGGYVEIPVQELIGAEGGLGTLTVRGISASALSLWVEVDQ